MVKEKEIKPEDELAYPTDFNEPEINPTSMIIFGKEKCGKSTIMSELPNALFIDTEKGSNKLRVKAMQPPENVGPVSRMQWLKKVAQKLIDDGKPFDYVIVDTLSEVNEWAEWSGTWRYMNSVQGKSFNRKKHEKTGLPIKDGPFLDFTDPDYESVHNLGEGYGYRWSREEVLQVFNLFMQTAKKCIIFVCHVEDKYVAKKDETDVVPPKQIALTGALRNILPRKVDAIGYIYQDEGVLKVNFEGSEDKLGGSRAKHLINYNGDFKWDKIFIKNK